jgi:type IV secretory pathway VirJ component
MSRVRTLFAAAFVGLALPAVPVHAGAPGPEVRLEALPLTEVPSSIPGRDEMAVLLTGDGGWALPDRGLAQTLAKGGVPVVGWSSLSYFWHRKTPARTTADLELILRSYLRRWHKERAILIGYSFGADVVPFLANRLPPDLAARLSRVVLLSPGGRAEFYFHFTDWLGRVAPDSLPVLPELERLRGSKILCSYGAQEDDHFCADLPPGLAVVQVRPGGHAIGRGFGRVAAWILASLQGSP